jgi:NAD(P)-dependent dehydrogenase (short-subunit alcohol dehydrogenase family)
MALSLAPHGIRVNGVGPGSINTDVLAAVANDAAAMGRYGVRVEVFIQPVSQVLHSCTQQPRVMFLSLGLQAYPFGEVV